MAKKRSADLSPAAIEDMIAEAAYYRAAERGFEPGHELSDWLAAETEIRGAQAPAAASARRRRPAAKAKTRKAD